MAGVGELVGVAYEKEGGGLGRPRCPLSSCVLLLLEWGCPSLWWWGGGRGGGWVWVGEGPEVREKGVSELGACDVACRELLVRRGGYWCWRGRRWHRGGGRLDVLK